MGRRWAAVVALIGGLMAWATLADPLVFLADDSWFYLVIGRNISQGHGITFSRVMATNGFQPLWQAVVALTLAVTRAFGLTSPLSEARSVLVVGWLLLGVAVWRLDVLLRRLKVPPPACALACLGVILYLGGPLGTPGSEANLVVLLVVLAVTATVGLVTSTSPTPVEAAGCGALLGLMVLGRLDTGFVAIAAVTAVGLAGVAPVTERWRAVVIAGATSAVVVAPYLLWNLVRFGHLLPIAGAIKLDTRQLWFTRLSIGNTGWLLFALIAVLAAVALIGRCPTRAEAAAFAVPLAGGLMSSAIYFAWSPGRFTDLDWYRMPQLVAAAVLTGMAIRRIAGWQPKLVTVGAPVLVALLIPALAFVMVDRRLDGPNRDFWHPVARFAQHMDSLVPTDQAVATVDYPGVIASFSGRRVVALDGLTGDYDFQDELRDRGGSCALADRGVRWLVVDNSDRLLPVHPAHPTVAYDVELASWLHHVGAGRLRLNPKTDLVYDDPRSDLSLWRVHPSCTDG